MSTSAPVALVTGGGTGIGRAIAVRLAHEHAAVAVGYSRSEAEANQTVEEIRGCGGRALAVRADVGDQRDVEAMVGRVAAELGPPTWLVNNAATTVSIPLGDLEAVTGEIFDRLFSVNVKGPFYCARAAAGYMRANGGGAIVNIGSIAGVNGDGSSLPYATSKAALAGLTRSLARALAPAIRVCCIAPGVVRTRWWEGRQDHMERLSSKSLLERTTLPEDIADMVVAVLRQPAITGQLIVVDGGQTL